jgi:hypothetical protein
VSAAIPSWIVDVEAIYVGDDNCTQLLIDLALDRASHPHFTLQSGLLRYKNRIVVGTSTGTETENVPSLPFLKPWWTLRSEVNILPPQAHLLLA